MSNAYIVATGNTKHLFTSTNASTWAQGSVVLTANAAKGALIPWDSVNSQFLAMDGNGKIYQVSSDANTLIGTVTAPTGITIVVCCDYKSSNGTLILGGEDNVATNAVVWYSTSYGSYTSVILQSGSVLPCRVYDIRYDPAADRWTAYVATTGTSVSQIYYSTNDGVSWTSASVSSLTTNNTGQQLQIGASNNILAQDVALSKDFVFSTNGTSYSLQTVTNGGATAIGGNAVQGFAYNSSGGLYMAVGNGPTSGTNGIATTTTPGTAASWTLYNNPNGAMGIQGAIQGGGNWLIFGTSAATGPGLVLSTDGSTFSDISAQITDGSNMIQSAGYASIAAATLALFFPIITDPNPARPAAQGLVAQHPYPLNLSVRFLPRIADAPPLSIRDRPTMAFSPIFPLNFRLPWLPRLPDVPSVVPPLAYGTVAQHPYVLNLPIPFLPRIADAIPLAPAYKQSVFSPGWKLNLPMPWLPRLPDTASVVPPLPEGAVAANVPPLNLPVGFLPKIVNAAPLPLADKPNYFAPGWPLNFLLNWLPKVVDAIPPAKLPPAGLSASPIFPLNFPLPWLPDVAVAVPPSRLPPQAYYASTLEPLNFNLPWLPQVSHAAPPSQLPPETWVTQGYTYVENIGWFPDYPKVALPVVLASSTFLTPPILSRLLYTIGFTGFGTGGITGTSGATAGWISIG